MKTTPIFRGERLDGLGAFYDKTVTGSLVRFSERTVAIYPEHVDPDTPTIERFVPVDFATVEQIAGDEIREKQKGGAV